MDIKEFYVEFNKITSNHTTAADTTTKLNGLLDSIKDTDVADAIDIDVEEIVTDLESQKENVNDEKVDEFEEQDSSYYDDYYDDSYESSY